MQKYIKKYLYDMYVPLLLVIAAWALSAWFIYDTFDRTAGFTGVWIRAAWSLRAASLSVLCLIAFMTYMLIDTFLTYRRARDE